ncbi:MAG: S41 family peptidase [Hyphomicrobiales bacterium]
MLNLLKQNQIIPIAFMASLGAATLAPFSAIAANSELAGIWQSKGYALWFDVQQDSLKVYQTTKDTCVEFLTTEKFEYAGQQASLKGTKLTGLGQYSDGENYSLSLKNNLLNFEVGKVNPIQAERVAKLPKTCDVPTSNTPINTFETYWQSFDENYPFFELRGVDWQKAYDTFRPQVTASTTDQELFDIIQKMITPLGDGHVAIISTVGEFLAVKLPDWAEGLEEEDMPAMAMLAPETKMIDGYKSVVNDALIYGKLREDVGYLNILTFDGLIDENGDSTVLKNGIAQVLEALKDTKTIVIDTRINFGGDDTAGLLIAGQFTDKSQKVFKKSVWVDGAFEHIADFELIPTAKTAYKGKVYLLTSRLTISAAETFALAMTQLPNVSLVGEPTNGMLSDKSFMALPNGWIGTISNEQYLSANDELFEAKGVPVDIDFPILIEDYTNKNDTMIEHVLTLIH